MSTGDYEQFLTCWKSAHKVIVLTGAGVSTLSGIPDFRGKNGFYSGSHLWHGYEKADLFDISFFHQHPEVFYQFAREYLYPMLDKEASIVHITLAKLQKAGRIEEIYTQNIDALHSKGGSTEVGELHGTLQYMCCTSCGKRTKTEGFKSDIISGKVPRCDCGGLIKPDVVFFGENLDESLLDKAFADSMRADMIWVLGSSLTVQPAASLPLYTKQYGGKVVIVNADHTPLDNMADFRFDDLAEFCRQVGQI